MDDEIEFARRYRRMIDGLFMPPETSERLLASILRRVQALRDQGRDPPTLPIPPIPPERRHPCDG